MYERLEPYLDQLRHLPEMEGVALRTAKQGGAPVVEIVTAAQKRSLPVRPVTSNLSTAIVSQVLAEARTSPGLLLCAPLVSDELGRRLNDADVNYVDLRGNARVRLEPGYLVWIV